MSEIPYQYKLVTGPIATKDDLQSFVAFLNLLKHYYHDNVDIPRTVIRLLHTYRPEQGLDKYLKLIKTLCYLLTNFPEDFLQYLLSIIPPPEHISRQYVIKEVFKVCGKRLLLIPAFYSRYERCIFVVRAAVGYVQKLRLILHSTEECRLEIMAVIRLKSSLQKISVTNTQSETRS